MEHIQLKTEDTFALDDIRVLIADDHDIVRSALDAFLLAYGMDPVGKASDGLEAVRLCGELKPDVVLMDLVMPQMDGVEATRIIRQRWPNVRIIALTSFNEDKLACRALQAGAIAYLHKNLSPSSIAYAIREAYAGRPVTSRPATDAELFAESR